MEHIPGAAGDYFLWSHSFCRSNTREIHFSSELKLSDQPKRKALQTPPSEAWASPSFHAQRQSLVAVVRKNLAPQSDELFLLRRFYFEIKLLELARAYGGRGFGHKINSLGCFWERDNVADAGSPAENSA